MKYFLGLVDGDGTVVARSTSELHAHGEATHVLDQHMTDQFGRVLARKGDQVRKPSPLEDPKGADDLKGHSLVLLCDLPVGDGSDEIESVAVPVVALGGGDGGKGTRGLDRRIAQLEALADQVKAQEARLAQLESAKSVASQA